ncbi:thiamine diphosphokinase [Ornithinibacillus bavariensis]|uniref:Thiamine diphosphokinase n=1 Tax=Ornithinibacillus bavariensis TaxID=545502 RepID=A0A919X7Y7_9BACI|nr:thiamine diphosphokinase [Ornithinibacillus bavariensis]GIO26107.1 thiamine pyrophosphokinase [Ornithinibacillus bavariensis]
MSTVAIVGNGPLENIPDLALYRDAVNIWIGADRGALTILEHKLQLDYAHGDFDSVSDIDRERIKNNANYFQEYPIEKDKTDLQIALEHALSLQPDRIYIFGATGGRLDHMLINVQLLNIVVKQQINAIIIDKQNKIEWTCPGTYTIEKDEEYEMISFLSMTEEVRGLTLTGFYYPLTNHTIKMGSTLSISNQLISNYGTFSYDKGIVLVVRSRG